MRRQLIWVALLCAPAFCAQQGLAQIDSSADLYSRKIVLFVGPDSGEVERLKSRMGEDDFYIVADDANWYQHQAVQLLDSLGIEHKSVKRRTMRFMVSGAPTAYSWTDVEEVWFVILYDGEKEPRVSWSVDLALDLGYFDR